MQHDKIHATDCADCEKRDGKIDRFLRVGTRRGALDDAQRVKLLEIADKCPVHRTLHAEVQVTTRLAWRRCLPPRVPKRLLPGGVPSRRSPPATPDAVLP